MADFDVNDLKTKYEQFNSPIIVVYVNGTKLDPDTSDVLIRRAEVELVSGFEAAIAEISLVGVFDQKLKAFKTDKIKNFILLGSTVVLSLGYGTSVREVFRGFIARVHFVAQDDVPVIQLTCMDIKGNLMADRHSKRLKSRYYSDAVKEILDQNALFKAKDSQGGDFITSVIDDTPDKPKGQGEGGGGESKTDDVRVEMVEESDYEFIVKAARKFNFEFFTVGGNLYFSEAKKNTDILIELSLGLGLQGLDVGYDITGLVKKVEVRNVDPDQGDFVGKTMKLKSTISMGNKASEYVEGQSMVYIDPTVRNKEEAEYRANYLSEVVNYRLGSIRADAVGLPELVPGRFITLRDMGKPVDNTFYLTRVRHTYTLSEFTTVIEGVANNIVK